MSSPRITGKIRQRHLGSLFEEDSSIDFRLGEGDTQKVFNHRVYHLLSAPEIIVMQFANSIDIPIEKHYEPSVARDEPSCFVVIDNRRGLRTVAIHRRKKAFGNPQQVARILSRTINARLFAEYCYSFDILPSYYAEDLFKTWTRLQQHSQNLIFSAPEGLTESEYPAASGPVEGRGKGVFRRLAHVAHAATGVGSQKGQLQVTLHGDARGVEDRTLC